MIKKKDLLNCFFTEYLIAMFKHLHIINDVLPLLRKSIFIDLLHMMCFFAVITHKYQVFRLSAHILLQAPKRNNENVLLLFSCRWICMFYQIVDNEVKVTSAE